MGRGFMRRDSEGESMASTRNVIIRTTDGDRTLEIDATLTFADVLRLYRLPARFFQAYVARNAGERSAPVTMHRAFSEFPEESVCVLQIIMAAAIAEILPPQRTRIPADGAVTE